MYQDLGAIFKSYYNKGVRANPLIYISSTVIRL